MQAMVSFWQRVRSLMRAAHPQALEPSEPQDSTITPPGPPGPEQPGTARSETAEDDSSQQSQSQLAMLAMSPSRRTSFPPPHLSQQRIADKARFYEVSAIYLLSKAIHDQCIAINRLGATK